MSRLPARATPRAFALAVAFVCGCADLLGPAGPPASEADPSPQSVCAKMGGTVARDAREAAAMGQGTAWARDVYGRLVGSFAADGALYHCFDGNDPAFLAHKAAQAKEDQEATEARTAEAKRQLDAEAASAAEKSCIESGKLSDCASLPREAPKTCAAHCIEGREPGLHARVQEEQAACEARFVAADGRRKFACNFPEAIPNVSEKEVMTALVTACQAHDWPALDAVVRSSDGLFYASSEGDCTKACNERGRNLVAAARESPGLVRSYKLCMVAADSTLEARKLDAYEETLYCDYIHKADSRCRETSRCDWLEGYSEMRCTYDSPGGGRCQ